MNRVTIDALATAAGIGKRTAIRLVREGRLPGFMAGREYICTPGEFEDWHQGRWQFRGIHSDPPEVRDRNKKPLQFIQSVRKEGAA